MNPALEVITSVNIKFCEPPFERSPHIAEFWNTLSSFAYCLPPIYFYFELNRYARQLPVTFSVSVMRRYYICLSSWFFLGFGSAAFHATQTGWGEVLDEVGMVMSIATTCIALYDVHPLTAGKRGIIFYTSFMLFTLGSSLAYINMMYHPFFAVCFMTSVLVVVLLVATLPVLAHRRSRKLYAEDPGRDPLSLPTEIQSLLARFPLRASLRLSVVLTLTGYLIWHVDQRCVHEDWPFPTEAIYELYWYYWSHPLWHMLTTAGVFFLIHSIIIARIETARSKLRRNKGTTGSFVTLYTKSMTKTLMVSLGLPIDQKLS